MKKLINTALIAIALMSTTAYATDATEAGKIAEAVQAAEATEATENEIAVRTAKSFACAVMEDRGSNMFC